MAYTASVGTVPTTAGFAMYLLVTTMVSAGWTIKASGDGVSNYDSTGGTAITGGGTGAHGYDNNNAWIRIQAPAVNGGSVVNQTREWIFQRGPTNNKGWRFKYSASAGFTGGSPSITQTPSSTDEVTMLGGGTDAAPAATANWFTTDATYRWHIMCGGSAEFYSFNVFAVVTGSVTPSQGMFMDVLATGSYPTSDVDPCVTYCSPLSVYNSQNTFAQLGGAITTATSPAQARAWMGATSAAGVAVTGTNSVGIGMAPYGNTTSSVMGGSVSIGTNPFSAKDDMLPAWYLRPGSSVSPSGVKGCSTLFSYGSVIRQFMDTADVAGTKDRVFIGTTGQATVVWGPWNGSVPLI